MSDPGMIGESSLEKRMIESLRRLDERIDSERHLTNEKFAHSKSIIEGNDKRYAERFEAQKEANAQRFDAQEVANKYDQEKSNEFRGALEDVGKRQMPRTECEAMFKAISENANAAIHANSEKIAALQARLDRNEGRGSGFDAGWKILIGVVALAAALLTIFLGLKP